MSRDHAFIAHVPVPTQKEVRLAELKQLLIECIFRVDRTSVIGTEEKGIARQIRLGGSDERRTRVEGSIGKIIVVMCPKKGKCFLFLSRGLCLFVQINNVYRLTWTQLIIHYLITFQIDHALDTGVSRAMVRLTHSSVDLSVYESGRKFQSSSHSWSSHASSQSKQGKHFEWEENRKCSWYWSFSSTIIWNFQEVWTSFGRHGWSLFCSVVPRTFLGPIFIALQATPFTESLLDHRLYLQYIGKQRASSEEDRSKEHLLLLVRVLLGIWVISGLTHLYKSLKGYCDLSTRRWWLLVIVTQFHFLFYSSRTLPNIFALVLGNRRLRKSVLHRSSNRWLVLHCFALWLSGQEKLLVWTSAFAILIFRSELVVLLSLILLQEVFVKRRLPFMKALGHGLCASALAVGKFSLGSRRRWIV